MLLSTELLQQKQIEKKTFSSFEKKEKVGGFIHARIVSFKLQLSIYFNKRVVPTLNENIILKRLCPPKNSNIKIRFYKAKKKKKRSSLYLIFRLN